MQPLTSIRRMMMWLSMCSADESSNARHKMGYFAHSFTVLLINLVCLFASLAFCVKFVSIDFNGAVLAFMIAIGELGAIYFMIASILMRYQIGSIFSSLSSIYRSNNENEEIFQYLVQANSTSEWMWTIYLMYVIISTIGLATTSLLSVVYCYFAQGNFHADHFYRPGTFVLPWNQMTYLGYLAEVCVTLPINYGYLIVNGTPFLFFISLCLHHQAFSKMFKHSTEKSTKCDAKMLRNLIRFHISIKNLFLDSANVYRSFVLVQLICSAVLMTISVFYIDLQWQHFDFTVATVMISTSTSMSTVLLYCYFGKLATESYEMISDCVFDMKWHDLPNELQKYFILMLTNMQKPVYYHGFKVANLDLGTFIKLCKSVISYYMMIKTLASK